MRWIPAAAAGLWLAAQAAGQAIPFEPPQYRGSQDGVPLAGQDGWYLPLPGAIGWEVYTNGGSDLELGPLAAGGAHVAGVLTHTGLDSPAVIERGASFGEALAIVLDVAVEQGGPLPAGEEIWRFSLEPEGRSRSFVLVASWDDSATAQSWRIELRAYTAGGEPERYLAAQGLSPGIWHELVVHADFFFTNQVGGIRIVNKTTWERTIFDPRDAYMAGGAGGSGLAWPTAFRVSGGDGRAAGLAVAIDNLWISERSPCYSDCDRDGASDFFDFLCFQNRFAARDPYADCDGTGTLDFFDFLCFQQDFVTGCRP